MESYGRLGVSAMQFLNALDEAALASSAAGTDQGSIHHLGASRAWRYLCAGNELIYREAMHVYASVKALADGLACADC
jgi:hypothetical protein